MLDYLFSDPLRILYILGGTGGIWFWIKEYRSRIRLDVRFLDQEGSPGQGHNYRVKLRLEAENFGTQKTSLRPFLTVRALSKNRQELRYKFRILNDSRTLEPFEPRELVADAMCSSDYLFTWFRSIKISPTRGRSKSIYILNASDRQLNWLEFWMGRMMFKYRGHLPDSA